MATTLSFGEMLIRLTPLGRGRLKEAGEFSADYGGAEANVAVSLSEYGHVSKYFSALPSHEIGHGALQHLQKYGVDTSFVYRIGERLGTYFYEPGHSLRNAAVIYDRAHSSFLDLPNEKIEWGNVFEGVDLLHLTGITPALNRDMVDFTIEVLEAAKKHEVTVSFDMNYRSKLWSLTEAEKTFKQILPYVDICFASHKDLGYLLDSFSMEDFNKDVLKDGYRKLAAEYGVTYLASTHREVISNDHNRLSGYFYVDGEIYESAGYEFHIVERIGGGDAFSAGILHGILSDFSPEDIVHFGTGAGVIKHTVAGDHNTFTKEEVLEFIRNQGQDVSR